MKNSVKNLCSTLAVICLVGCSNNSEYLAKIEQEYEVLDYNILVAERDLLSQIIQEQQKSLNAMNAISVATGVLSFALTGYGSFSTSESKQLDYDKLVLEALNNLIEEKKPNQQLNAQDLQSDTIIKT